MHNTNRNSRVFRPVPTTSAPPPPPPPPPRPLAKTAVPDDYYEFACPHCGDGVQVPKKEVNCGIFRHGAAIDPHASKSECDRLFPAGGSFRGCGKPFRLTNGVATVCDYL